MRLSLASVALLLLLSSSLGSPSNVQAAGQSVEGGDRLIEIDVVVANKKGEPILGLSPEHFRVTIDGLPGEISAFERAAAAEGEPAETRSIAMRPFSGLYLLIFLDAASLPAEERNEALVALAASLDPVRAVGTRIMISTLDSSGLHVSQPFTNDIRLVSEQLARLQQAPGATSRGSELQEIVREIERAATTAQHSSQAALQTRIRTLETRIRTYGRETGNSITQAMGALRVLVDSMSGLVGRKAVLYIGSGIPFGPDEKLMAVLQDTLGRFSQERSARDRGAFSGRLKGAAETETQALADAAAAGGVVVYPLEATGLRFARQSADTRVVTSTVPDAPGTTPGTQAYTGPRGLEIRNSVDLQAGIQVLARETGGVAFLGAGQAGAALRQYSADLVASYRLGVRDPHGPDEDLKRVVVSVEGRGIEVRHPSRHRALSADRTDAGRTQAALLFGPDENPLGVSAVTEAPRAVDDHLVIVPLTIRLPLNHLSVVPRSNTHEGQLSVFLATGNDESGAADLQKHVLPIRIPNDEILTAVGREIEYRVELRVPADSTRVAIGVRDDHDPGLSTLRVDLVPTTSPQGLP